jgi:hypothetical protein
MVWAVELGKTNWQEEIVLKDLSYRPWRKDFGERVLRAC